MAEKTEKKEPKSSRLYKDSPKLERGENGDVGITKGEAQADDNDAEDTAGTDGSAAEMGSTPDAMQSHERVETHDRHVSDTRQMSRRHEMEHSSGKADPKKHIAEHKEMTDRHHEEFSAMTKRHGKTSNEKKESK